MSTLLWALTIFAVRAFGVALGTLRIQSIVRGKKLPAALAGFVEATLYILVASRVLRGIQNWVHIVAYCAGFAVGTLVGVTISSRFPRPVRVSVISRHKWEEVKAALWEAGFGLTQYAREGRDGYTGMIDVVCTTRQLPRLLKIVSQTDPGAFLYTRELTGLQGGHVYGLKGKL
jgi:uncharacterized protein YebE (UPF0316 family)